MSGNPPNSGDNPSERAPTPAGKSLKDMVRAEPIRASEAIPDAVLSLLRPENALYALSASAPKIEMTTERMGATEAWRVVVRADGRELHAGLPGEKQIGAVAGRVDRGNGFSDSHRPLWLDLEYLPKLVPFRAAVTDRRNGRLALHQFVEPLSRTRNTQTGLVPLTSESLLRYSYPWCTIGCVFVGDGTDFANPIASGSGVLVGHNLMLTASHVAPWGRGPGQWWMRFVPGYRYGDRDPEPHSSSYVERFYGTFSDIDDFEASGQDYVICKLYRPLGNALGWMGTRSFGYEDDYFARRYVSVGYPGSFGGKPAVEFDIDIDDIDWDGDGLELETTHGTADMGRGWSGGPLWLWENDKPYVVGIMSGHEKDELDPRRYVFGGGGLMVQRVKFGQANFA
ncbi:MAG TPA: hypothetical protein VJ890_06025 [Vineibacter sp.]|nr:hypothetical protein [Vineibacter sp.]